MTLSCLDQHDPHDPPGIRINEPGELIAAVPALLGFHPTESLVLVATGGRSRPGIGLTLRMDLPAQDADTYPELAGLVSDASARGLLLDAPSGAAVLVVATAQLPGDPPHPMIADRVARALDHQGVHPHTVLWAEATTAGARWACYEPCGCTGVVPDPATTAFVAATVAAGRVVHTDRKEMERIVAPDAQHILRRREELMVRTLSGDACLDPAAPEAAGAGVALVDAAIADAATGELGLTDRQVVALAIALAVPEVRDTALRRCTGDGAAAAEQLWAALTRATPAPEVALPASLLATSALLRGDGALANVALDRAEQAWPGHRFSGVLRMAAQAGHRPEQIREWLVAALDAV